MEEQKQPLEKKSYPFNAGSIAMLTAIAFLVFFIASVLLYKSLTPLLSHTKPPMQKVVSADEQDMQKEEVKTGLSDTKRDLDSLVQDRVEIQKGLSSDPTNP